MKQIYNLYVGMNAGLDICARGNLFVDTMNWVIVTFFGLKQGIKPLVRIVYLWIYVLQFLIME